MENKRNRIKYSDIKDDQLIKAFELCENKQKDSHSPYSNVKVVAVAILDDGELVYATNQENVAFPSGICAEVNLLGFCGSNRNHKKIKTIVVRGFKEIEMPFISPCGNCRQVMLETEVRQGAEIEVVFGSKESGFFVVNSCRELLPYFFSSDSVELM